MVKPPPQWFRPALLALAAIVPIALFSREISDTDFWWTLKSGQYIAQTHRLPAPDPFAFTTPMARDAYTGESIVRRFNLTFEWMAQLIFYGVYSAAGFGGIVFFRALLLAGCCALMGLSGDAAAVGSIALWPRPSLSPLPCLATTFNNDRSYLFTFFLLAATLAILEFQRPPWLLPAMALVWANCHGGFFLQWIAVGAYCAEAAYLRYRGRPQPAERKLWTVLAACVLASAVNPNGYRVLQALGYFRSSFLQSKLLEWQAPILWPLNYPLARFFLAAAATLLWARKRVRPIDWLLFLAFSAAALAAQRNTFSSSLLGAGARRELPSVETRGPRDGALRRRRAFSRGAWDRYRARGFIPIPRGHMALPVWRGRFSAFAQHLFADVQHL